MREEKPPSCASCVKIGYCICTKKIDKRGDWRKIAGSCSSYEKQKPIQA